ncbi:glutamate--tRNA ligase family protein [Flammeovirgaceae bacterium SG7u.111]|nr:glutamate--tRNA ligase family protein [Flammeovirgaceae bacterium SG7u.132]WPO37045.1 glutamate--tRNA ligase family protein [Flammeovirgaceae bacterium SG7u.111]
MKAQILRTRIAPTPSGYLHQGNAFSFLLTWLIAKKKGGKILLRIDDIDAARTRPEYLEDIFQTLDWLGIEPDEGPSDVSDFQQNFSQHLRLENYNILLEQLKSKSMLFSCDCSRSQIKKASTNGQYPGTCRSLAKPFNTPNHAWRIITLKEENYSVPDLKSPQPTFPLTQQMKDFVVKKKDGLPSYQIASLADDLYYNINFIVRGEDLVSSTSAQHFLAKKLDLSHFLHTQFLHHSLLLDASGQKLSKSEGAISIKYLRENEISKKNLLSQMGKELGLLPTHCENLNSMLDNFEINAFLGK